MAAYLLDAASKRDIALVDADEEYTYGQLRRAVRALSARLRAAGLPAGAPVALLAPNGLFWVAAYIATMDAGLVTVPLPASLSSEEAAARIRWVGARAVFVAEALERALREVLSPDAFLVTESAAADIVEANDRPRSEVDLDDDAAYLFTSGTTGTPRAVRLTHRNLRANTQSILDYLDLRSSDRVLVVLPFPYVYGASLLHTHLRVGATLVIQRSAAYPETTVNLLESQGCTVFAGVPSVYHNLLRKSSFVRRPLRRLRLLQQAGGRLPPALLRELVAAQPQARVFAMYGQTEATARLSALEPEQLLRRPGSIGRGIPGVTLRVVDDEGRDVRPGQIGEIRARGENVSPGYLHDPVATERKMGGGELRTGDLATVDDEGYIFIVDRAEDFIKCWGHRVASQEVEAAAMELADLVAVAAVGVPDAAAGERIELMIVARPASVVRAEDVLAHCRARLPRHSIPAAVHFVDRLPTSANGKVVKQDVRQWILAHAEDGGDDARHG